MNHNGGKIEGKEYDLKMPALRSLNKCESIVGVEKKKRIINLVILVLYSLNERKSVSWKA